MVRQVETEELERLRKQILDQNRVIQDKDEELRVRAEALDEKLREIEALSQEKETLLAEIRNKA